MKTTGELKHTIDKVHANWKSTVVKSGVQSSTKRTSEDTPAVLETEKVHLLEPYPKRHLLSTTKIKLQLFPVDESTRVGLEKDGYCPYLELSLKAKKKISSVLRHLNSKWENSSVAKGKLVLLPFIKKENLFNCLRWTSYDHSITAADVYGSLGSPSVFRLRYGWLSTVTFDVCLDSGHAQKDCSFSKECEDEKGEQIETTIEDFNFRNMIEANCTLAADSISNKLIVPEEKEQEMDSELEKSSMFYPDGLTNISIGAILSEASLLEKISYGDPKVTGKNTAVRPTQRVSGHFTASPVQANCSQDLLVPQPDNQLGTSLLDAEETCHAFLVKNFSPAIKGVLTENADVGNGFPDGGSKSFKFHKPAEINRQVEVSSDYGRAHKKSKPSQMYSRVYPDECSLGLRDINWSDSLGPFDLGMPSQKFLETRDEVGGFYHDHHVGMAIWVVDHGPVVVDFTSGRVKEHSKIMGLCKCETLLGEISRKER